MSSLTVKVAAALALLHRATATNFLNHGQLLAGLEDPAWFEANIPILDVPNAPIQSIYYYRWQNYREHLSYTSAQYGYLSTEFLGAVGYAGPYGAISAAAGHHITEGRWLRDQKPGKDLVNFWLAGPGQFSKPANDADNPDTYDWAHEYSFWAASAVWKQYQATGDRDFAVGHLDNLVKVYRAYDNHYNSTLGLYWQAPVWDASEFTVASYESSDPYHGGYGFRPTINSYQYGDAMAISAIAKLAGNTALANEYSSRATALQNAVQKTLWDGNAKFFKHLARDNNPSNSLLDTREIMGYIPWMFNLPNGGSYSSAFSQLKDPKGFAAPFGPTTAENRSSLFYHEAENGCCRWDGPSWPFATAQTLTAAENLLNDYPSQSFFTASDYFSLLLGYANTQMKNGVPHVAEAHEAYIDSWIYDSPNHSEDYNHSTFVENIIAGLIGLRAQSSDSIVINPLAPTSWDHFALENAPYHGHSITVVWDKTGSHYNQGQGLRVWVDDKFITSRADLGSLTVNVGSANKQTISSAVNIAANPLKFSQGTQPMSSFESGIGGDSKWNAIDGSVFRLGIPENSRWTTYSSSSASDWFGVDLRRTQAISEVHVYFYDDNDGVRVPTSYDLQYLNGQTWTTIPSQQRSGTLSNNAQIKITFPTITSSQLRIVAPNRGGGTGWGISEFQVWTAPIFQILNVNSNKLMGVDHESTANSASVQQYEDNGSRDHLWNFIPASGGWLKIQNVNSGKLLAVAGASRSDSAQLTQFEDNGTDDHLWRVEDKGNGQFVIRNKNSGLVAAVDGESKDNSANVVQFDDNGTPDHLWELLAAVPAS